MNADWDAVVIGAGPAGSLAARQLALRGARVLLLDKAAFPRPKVCGCCINDHALSTLRSVGLLDCILKLDAVPLRIMRLATASAHADVALEAGICLSREAFDQALVDAAGVAGAVFSPSTEAAVGDETHDGWNIRLGSDTIHARVVVIAAGLRPPSMREGNGAEPGSRIGAGATLDAAPNFYRRHVVHMACGSDGYVGIVQLEDGRWNLAAAFDRDAVRRVSGPGPLAAQIVHQAGWPALPGLEQCEWRGTVTLTRHPRRVWDRRMFLVGDAAGYVEPFTGEGIAWALASAAACVPWALRALDGWDDSLGEGWTRMHQRLIGDRQRLCRTASRVLRSPFWSAAALHAVRLVPWLASPVLRRLNAPSQFEKAMP
ncbi:MAG: NAD(P)/FAD-dependent oxidoreductase [Gemmataceae bacterium]|nr:NAD(P)/FAD-dependent oxidoreductase [Gemmataceae bacterium]